MTYVYLAAAIFVLFLLISEYNTLIAKRNFNDYAFSQVDVFLKKRHDLIPNLVATAGTYMKYEKETLESVTAMRARAVSGALSPEQRAQVEGQISKALGSIMVSVEKYPELKADQNFLRLQAALNEIEEQIAAARRAYNAAATDYNNALQMFPTRLMGVVMGFQTRPVFAATAEDRENPDVARQFKA